MLAMNIQTSFLHPPFGFSLFYLRSVAPNEDYTDSKTGKFIERIKTSQIYQGALPFLFIQIIMVFIIILLPELVSVEHDKVLDLNAIYKQIPSSPKVPDFSDKWFE
jgi:TRAP-type mannitol/chloroaromatic compound transport system permease large subunit